MDAFASSGHLDRVDVAASFGLDRTMRQCPTVVYPLPGGCGIHDLSHLWRGRRLLVVGGGPPGSGRDNGAMKPAQVIGAALLAIGLAACAPEANWRVFSAEGSGVVSLFPCRPDHHVRPVRVADAPVRMEMLVCAAGGSTFALGFLDVSDPARVNVTLGEMRSIALANVRGAAPQLALANIAGMTPNPQAVRLSTGGTLPGGSAVRVHAAFFAKGLRVYQATVMGAEPSSQWVETFFDGLKFPP